MATIGTASAMAVVFSGVAVFAVATNDSSVNDGQRAIGAQIFDHAALQSEIVSEGPILPGETFSTSVTLPATGQAYGAVLLTGDAVGKFNVTAFALSRADHRWPTITAQNTSASPVRFTALVSYSSGASTTVNFETGDVSQARGVEANSLSRVPVLGTTVRRGSYAMHAICDISDPPVLNHNHRSEIQIGWPVFGEWWYGASVNIPATWSNDDTSCSNCSTTNHYHLPMQWHQNNECYPSDPPQPPLQLSIHDSTIEWIQSYGGPVSGINTLTLWSDNVDNYKGVWTDWVIQANWTTTPGEGFYRIWKNGVQVVEYHGKTLHPNGCGVYFKTGLTYDLAQSRDLWIDEVHMADKAGNYATVAP